MSTKKKILRAQNQCESRGGRPGLPVSYSPYGLSGRKAALNFKKKETAEKQQQQQNYKYGSAIPSKVSLLCLRKFCLIFFHHVRDSTMAHAASRLKFTRNHSGGDSVALVIIMKSRSIHL